MYDFLRNTLNCGYRLVLPPHCASCGNPLDDPADSRLLCTACRDSLFSQGWRFCLRCGSSTIHCLTATGCPECRARRFRFDAVIPLGVYAGRLRECVLRMKRVSGIPLARVLGDFYCSAREPILRELDGDAVVATPMHWTRRLGRGTNSPEILTERIAHTLKIPNVGKKVWRLRKTRPQAGLSPTKRRDNVRNAFCVKSERNVEGRRIILVDDILTTGATCHEIAKVLKAAGAARVFVAVLARAEGPDSRLSAPSV